MTRATTPALGVLFALIPLYGTLAALDPSRPPIPRVVPDAVAAGVGLLTLAALLVLVPAIVRASRRDALTVALLVNPGCAPLVAALAGFDPVTGTGLSVLVAGVGGTGLVLARSADAGAVRVCVRAFLWSALLASLAALAMLLLRRPAALYAYDNGRAVGTFLNPNELAAYALVGLGIALPPAFASRGRDRLATVTAVVLAGTLAATFSRWGAFSAVCGLAAYGLFARSRRLLVACIAVALVAGGLDLAAGARHHNPRDTESRAVAWEAGLTTFARFPLLGVGPLAFARTYEQFRPPDAPGPATPVAFDPHSLPIAFAADGGIVAVVTVSMTIGILLRRILISARRVAPVPRSAALGLAAGLVALLVDCGINTISLFFPLLLMVTPLALAVTRTDAV